MKLWALPSVGARAAPAASCGLEAAKVAVDEPGEVPSVARPDLVAEGSNNKVSTVKNAHSSLRKTIIIQVFN